MKRTMPGAATLAIALGLLAHAQDAKFPGRYTVTNIVENAEGIHATLAVRLFNLSGAAVTGAHLFLKTGLRGSDERRLPANVTFGPGEETVVRAEVLVSSAEFRLWRVGARPRLVLEFQDSEGNETRQMTRLNLESGAK